MHSTKSKSAPSSPLCLTCSIHIYEERSEFMILRKGIGKISEPSILLHDFVIIYTIYHSISSIFFVWAPYHFAWFGAIRDFGWSLRDYFHEGKIWSDLIYNHINRYKIIICKYQVLFMTVTSSHIYSNLPPAEGDPISPRWSQDPTWLSVSKVRGTTMRPTLLLMSVTPAFEISTGFWSWRINSEWQREAKSQLCCTQLM